MANHIPVAKVLIVTDSDDFIALSQYLNQMNYWIFNVRSGEDALYFIQQNDTFPDIILMGVSLPGMDGFEVAKIIKRQSKGKNIPIIFITVLNSIEDKTCAFEVGAVDYITKPFDPREAVMRINVHIQTRQLQKELELKNERLEHEIRSQEHTQAELKKALQYAQNSNESKNMLMAYLTHEIRNLMNGIVGMNQLLLQSSLDACLKPLVNQMAFSCEMLMRLVNDTLDFSKLEYGKFELLNAEFSLHNMLILLKDIVEPMAKQKNLKVYLDVQEGLPEYCLGDVVRIQQILLNLVSNSIKFTKNGKICIGVKSLEHVNKKILLKFSVQDTGIGISKEYQEKLFKPFFQVVSPNFPQEGSGLGLTISKKLVELMGGTIGFESTEEIGTTFWFTLLLEPCFWYKNIETQSCENKIELSHYNLRILLVEDDIINQKVALLLLKNIGLTADIANNGREALEILKIKNFDLILMDILMPEMDGMELTANIRSGKCANKMMNIPIIAITANALQEDRDRYLKIGMNDYVAKPIQISELRQAILRQIHKMDVSFKSLSKTNDLEHSNLQLENKSPMLNIDDISVIEDQILNLQKNIPHINPQVFNFDSFLERMGGDMEVCNSVLQYVPENLEKDLEILHENFLKKDIPAILGQAHSIKGMMANISAERLQNIAYQIEYAGKNDDWQSMFVLLKKLEEEVKKFLQTLQQHLSKQLP